MAIFSPLIEQLIQALRRLPGVGPKGAQRMALHLLGRPRIRLMTNNPDKVAALSRHGINVVERVAHRFPTNPHNEAYLATKKAKAGHAV